MTNSNKTVQYSLRSSKKLPVVIKWGKMHIFLAELELLKNGSLVFETAFQGSGQPDETIESGLSNFKDGAFRNHMPDPNNTALDEGCHITLHPPKDDKTGVMYFRKHSPGDVLFRREINWFPVTKPFNVLHAFTPPLKDCPSSAKHVTITEELDSSYEDSLELIVDILPKDTKEYIPYEQSVEVWGICPHYLVRVSIARVRGLAPSIVYWPDDNLLEL